MKKITTSLLIIVALFAANFTQAQTSCANSIAVLTPQVAGDGSLLFAGTGQNADVGATYGAEVSGRLNGGWTPTSAPTLLPDACTAWIYVDNAGPVSALPKGKTLYYHVVMTDAGVTFTSAPASFKKTDHMYARAVNASGKTVTFTSENSTARPTFSFGTISAELINSVLADVPADENDVDETSVERTIGQTQSATEEAITVFPNPMTTTATVLNPGGHEAHFVLYNLMGQTVGKPITIPEGFVQCSFSRADLASGTYIWSVTDKNGNSLQKGKITIE